MRPGLTPPAPPTTDRPSPARRSAIWLHRHARVRLGLLLAAPGAWLVVVYLGSLLLFFSNAFWQRDEFTGHIIHDFTFQSFIELADAPYPEITLRTVVMAIAVTITCALIAFPIALYMARVASRRMRAFLIVAVVVPLWASYVIKVYSWRLVIAEEGVLNWLLEPLGLKGPGQGIVAVWLVLSYLWLPYMILPIYAGLERIPNSLLEASADLGGRSLTTFRRVVMPLVMPAVLAGSIFTFSLTIGDYIAPALMSTTIFIGNAIFLNVGAAGDIPFAAAYSLVPLVIIVVYLFIARRFGAFEAL
jgi:putative spermidine/putrescine transport system permease protein